MAWNNRIVGHGSEDPEQLLANPKNWRIHPRLQQKALEATIDRVGFIRSVTVNRRTGYVLDGHLRVALAISEGEKEIPVEYVDLSPEEETEALVMLDPIAAMAGTDAEILTAVLDGIDMEALAEQQQALIQDMTTDLFFPSKPADPTEDEAEVLQVKWKTEIGQVWLLGDRHKLLCGDATNKDQVASLEWGKSAPTLMVTDPPYGVNYDARWREEAAEKGLLSFAGRRIRKVANDDRVDWAEAWDLFPGDVVYVWHGGIHTLSVAETLKDFQLRAQIIWVKPHFAISRGHYTWRHEPCWYAVRTGKTSHWISQDHSQSTLWDASLDPNVTGKHSTQKPVELYLRPIRNHAGSVYDPFVGTGTAIVAAEILHRTCFAVDIDPAYVAVVLERWQNTFESIPELINQNTDR